MSDYAVEICQTLRDGSQHDRGSVRRRAGRIRLAVLALVVCATAFAFSAASAQALLVHTFSFGTQGSGAGQFNSPQGVAVNESTGDVYVVDGSNFRVEKFTPNLTATPPTAAFDLAFGMGVDKTTGGNICTATSGDTCQAGTSGSAAGAFQTPQFVAVDNSTGPSAGDVYVGDPGDDTVSKFDSSGNLITSWGTGGQLSGTSTFGSIDGITVDPSGNLLVINGNNPVFEFKQDGSSITSFGTTRGMSAAGLDVNTAGDIFKVNGDGSPEEVTSSGADIGTVSESNGTTTGLVIDRSSGDLYQDVGTQVNHYHFDSSGNVVEPGGTTCPVVSSGSCGATDTFGSSMLGAGTGIGFNSTATTAFVADASNGDVAVFGPPAPGAPVIDGESATNIGNQSATLTAQVNPFGVATTCTFQYVTNATYVADGNSFSAGTTTVPCSQTTLGSSFADQTASANVTGLTLNTEYDFRVIAVNGDGTVNGNAATFTTLGPATIDSESATNVGSTVAQLDTLINPLGNDTSCKFEYVDDATFQTNGGVYTSSVPCTPSDLGAGNSDVSALANITGLTPGTLYDFRAVATNTLGTENGSNVQFTTGPTVSIDSESTSNVGSTAAQLDAQINPEGTDTTCQFQYVDDTDFQSTGFTGSNVVTVACTPADLGAGIGDVGALANISGLTPNTTYDFRAVGTNSLTGTSGVDGAAAQFTTAPPASIDSESASPIGPQSATLNASINPEGTDTTCQFQYVDDTDFKSTGFAGSNVVTVACSPSDLGAGVGDVGASAAITGLTPSTTYDFRAVATNSLAPSGVDGAATQFTTTPPVLIDSQSVANVTDTTATLNAQVNPQGLDSHYQFQYVTDANFKSSGYANATTVPPHPVDIGNGVSDQHATVDLTGLSTSTKYHFRVVASNAAGSVNGSDQTFNTFASGLSAGLPDGRAYEQVTPVSKDSGEPGNRNGLGGSGVAIDGQFIAGSTGNAFSYFSFNAFPGSASDGGFYVANRATNSWVSQNLIPPQSAEGSLLCATLGGIMVDYTADLSQGILEDGANLIPPCGQDFPNLVPGEPQGIQNMFVFNPQATGAQPRYRLVDGMPTSGKPSNASFDGAASDLSTVVFDENAPLTSNAPAGDNLYSWSASTGKDALVTVLPDGTAASGSLAGGSVNSNSTSFGQAFHAVSDDGSKIFFTASNGTTTNLYVRENGSSTKQVDASQTTPPGTGGGGQFLAATSTGSNVFFTDGDSAGLTSDTVTGSGSNLYDYNTVTNTLTNLTGSSVLGSDKLAQVQGLAGIDGSGAFLYFVADGALNTNPNPEGQRPQSGQNNLYVLHNGTIAFIDTLSGSDGNDWSPSSLSARTSGNGTFLAFTSTNGLTGYNNNNQPEIFLYDAGANTVSCASCIPTGVPATNGASIEAPALSTPLVNFGTAYLQHNVSNSGQVFFDTADALVPTATNGQPDVYEYESGQVHLLSSGSSVDPALFADATANGSDVFFITSAQLVPQDTDSAFDVYDARVGGGFPPSAPPASCQGENCKPPQTSAPPVPSAASVTFSGPGNAKAAVDKITVLALHIKGDRVTIRVRVPAKGRISVAGAGLNGTSRRVSRAGVYNVTVRLRPRAMTALKHKVKLKLTIRVGYTPAVGHASTATIKLTVKA